MITNSELNFMIGAAIIAYLLAALSALLLFRRTTNKRIKIMGITAVLVCLHEVLKLVQKLGSWDLFPTGYASQMADLSVASMILVWVVVLKKESSAWKLTDERVRLAEAAARWLAAGGETGKPPIDEPPFYHPSRWLRFGRRRQCLYCDRPIRAFWGFFSQSPFCNSAHHRAFFSEFGLSRLQPPVSDDQPTVLAAGAPDGGPEAAARDS